MNAPLAYGVAIACVAVGLLCWPTSVPSTITSHPANARSRRASPPRWVAFQTGLTRASRRQLILTGAVGGMAAAAFAGALTSLAGGIAGGLAGVVGYDSLTRRRAERHRLADVESLQVLADELRAGQDLGAAFRAAGGTDGGELSRGLRSAAAAIQVGADPARLLVESGAGQDAKRLAALYRLAGKYGVPLADAVEDLALLSRGALARDRHIKAMLAGPGATALLLCLLPVFGIVMGEAIDARPIAFLTGSTVGGLVLLAGVALAGTGLLWTRALVSRVREAT